MDEGKVGLVEHMVEVVVVVVDLRRRELALVDDVLGREGADVETLGQRTTTCRRVSARTGGERKRWTDMECVARLRRM